MRSPFPGMDPYLELHWRDVHHRLITYATDQIQTKLPGDLIARMEEEVYVQPHDLEPRERLIYPDVRVTEHPHRKTNEGEIAVAEVVAEPLVIRFSEPTTEGYIEIREANAEKQLVTVIEILSPSNKSGPKGRKLYQRKQEELLDAGVSLVEIDLLRRGAWVMSVPKSRVPRAYHNAYCACVQRGWAPYEAELYRFSLRERLPAIKIPLRESDADVPLNLQALVDQSYANGRYDSIDYGTDLDPPFDATDAAWANDLLKAAGRR